MKVPGGRCVPLVEDARSEAAVAGRHLVRALRVTARTGRRVEVAWS